MGFASAADWLLGMQVSRRARAGKWMCLTGVGWSRCGVKLELWRNTVRVLLDCRSGWRSCQLRRTPFSSFPVAAYLYLRSVIGAKAAWGSHGDVIRSGLLTMGSGASGLKAAGCLWEWCKGHLQGCLACPTVLAGHRTWKRSLPVHT